MDGTVRFIYYFREIMKRIKIKLFQSLNIQDLLLNLDCFKDATSLNLNMEYHHITLCPISRKLCTIVLLWGKSDHQNMPMGLCNSPNNFQGKKDE